LTLSGEALSTPFFREIGDFQETFRSKRLFCNPIFLSRYIPQYKRTIITTHPLIYQTLITIFKQSDEEIAKNVVDRVWL
jgi:hypothetical protein